MSEDGNWTTETLRDALANCALAQEGAMEVELVEGSDPGLLITMTEFGDLPLLASVSGSQILIDTLLWPVDEVAHPAAFQRVVAADAQTSTAVDVRYRTRPRWPEILRDVRLAKCRIDPRVDYLRDRNTSRQCHAGRGCLPNRLKECRLAARSNAHLYLI